MKYEQSTLHFYEKIKTLPSIYLSVHLSVQMQMQLPAYDIRQYYETKSSGGASRHEVGGGGPGAKPRKNFWDHALKNFGKRPF